MEEMQVILAPTKTRINNPVDYYTFTRLPKIAKRNSPINYLFCDKYRHTINVYITDEVGLFTNISVITNFQLAFLDGVR